MHMGLKEKTILEIKKQSKNKSFNVGFAVPLGQDNGFRYFMKIYQVKESGNWNDPLIEVRIPPQKDNIVIDTYIGVKIPKELQ